MTALSFFLFGLSAFFFLFPFRFPDLFFLFTPDHVRFCFFQLFHHVFDVFRGNGVSADFPDQRVKQGELHFVYVFFITHYGTSFTVCSFPNETGVFRENRPYCPVAVPPYF